jgi:quercetin dioxygenase-like cupin family protein
MTLENSRPLVSDLREQVQFADRGIVSKTLHDSPAMKLVLFCFEPGQALSEHSAPFEAVIQVLEGSADVKLGGEVYDARPGALYAMPAGLPHSVTAKERFVFLLTMVRGRPNVVGP